MLLTGCSNISEDERLIYVKPAAVSRCVLIEDFTGQRCVNCPNATEEIVRLQEQYGEENVIAVAIHSGPLGFYTNNRFLGLKTETGEEYWNHWQLEYQPVGLIDRQGVVDYTSWGAKVHEELERTAPVSISIDVQVSDGKLSVNTQVMGTDGNTDGHLQLWLVEDDVNAFQLMPDGTRNDGYLHQHVFRTALNGTWGESLTVKEGETQTINHDGMELNEAWNVANLSVVAFVYNDQGVQQVTKKKVIINEQE